MKHIIKTFRIFLFCVSIFQIQLTYAQHSRIELSALLDKEKFKIVSLQQSGLIVAREGKRQIQLTCLNQYFDQLWQCEILFNQKYTGIHYDVNHSTLYILLNKTSNHEVTIIQVNLKNGQYNSSSIYTANNLKVKKLIALNQSLYIHANILERPLLLHIDLSSRKTSSFSFDNRGDTKINAIRTDATRELVELSATSFYQNNYKTTLHIYHKGKPLKKINLPNQKGKNLINAQWLPLINQTYFILGNYNLNIKREISQGLFGGQITEGEKASTIRFHNYASDKNYFSYLHPVEQDAMWYKITKLESQNRPFQMRYHSEPQEIQLYNNQVIIVDNAFDVHLTTQRYNSTRAYVPVPGGWYYSHATLSVFNLQGQHLWSNSINIDQIKAQKSKEIIQLGFKTDTIISALIHKNKIRYQYHCKNQKRSKKLEKDIAAKALGEKISLYADYQIESWFDNKFLIYGFQKIRFGAGKREVFFVETICL